MAGVTGAGRSTRLNSNSLSFSGTTGNTLRQQRSLNRALSTTFRVGLGASVVGGVAVSQTGCVSARTANPTHIIAIDGPIPYGVRSDFEPNPALQKLRLSPDQLKTNMPFFKMPISTGIMNFICTGKVPMSSNDFTILILPGYPDQLYTSVPLIQDLAPDFNIVGMEGPGRAWSNDEFYFKHPYTLDSSAYAILAFIHQLDLQNVIIVTHSTAQTEVMHALAVFGAEKMRLKGIVSINGWEPQLIPEPIPYGLEEKLTVNPLTAGPTWLAAGIFPEEIAGKTWRGMVDPNNKSKELDEATKEWAKVFKLGGGGYTPNKAYNTVRLEYVAGINAVPYAQGMVAYRENLTSVPVLEISAQGDITVRGARDKNGAEYGERKFAARQARKPNPLNRLEIIPGFHCVQFVMPEVVTNRVRPWIAELAAASLNEDEKKP